MNLPLFFDITLMIRSDIWQVKCCQSVTSIVGMLSCFTQRFLCSNYSLQCYDENNWQYYQIFFSLKLQVATLFWNIFKHRYFWHLLFDTAMSNVTDDQDFFQEKWIYFTSIQIKLKTVCNRGNLFAIKIHLNF